MKGMRVLLTGGGGYLGHHLRGQLAAAGAEVRCLGRSSAELPLDLAAPDAGYEAVRAFAPELVIHAAALSSMYACEQDPELALAVNAGSVERLRAASSARLVLISTDLVFDGEAAPYGSQDLPRPLGAYGRSKLEAERRVGAGDLVLRLPLLFGPSFDGRRGATDMLRQGLQADPPLCLFENEFRTPLHVADAARGILACAADPDRRGILHLAGAERLDRYSFARRFCTVAGLDLASFRAGVSEDPRRPQDVSLRADWEPGRSLDEALADC